MSLDSKKIMFLHTSSLLGGAERVFLDFFENLPSDVKNSALIALPDEGPLLDLLSQKHPHTPTFVYEMPRSLTQSSRKKPLTSFLSIAASWTRAAACIRKIRKKVIEEKIDVIYAQGIKAQLLSLPVRQFFKIPLIWHNHDFFPKLAFVRTFLKLWTPPQVSISISHAVKEDFLAATPSHWKVRNEVIHNSVDTSYFNYSPRQVLATPPQILMIGMLTPWKGQHLLIEAIAHLQKKGVALNASFIGEQIYKTHGETGYRGELIQLVKHHGLEENISFHGLQDDIRPFLKESDIAVHATISPEPFGKVIVEAMAAGVPVIASNGGGVREIIHDGETGFLFEMNNSEDLAKKIETVLTERDTCEKVVLQARRRVEESFSSEHFSEKMTATLTEAL